MNLSSCINIRTNNLYNVLMDEPLFKDLFWELFLSYQRSVRKPNVSTFARHLSSKNSLGVTFSQPLVSSWLNGDYSPSEKYAPALAEFMGKEIYDVLHITPPDPDLQAITKVWDLLPEKSRRAIREQAETYAAGIEKKTKTHERKPSQSLT